MSDKKEIKRMIGILAMNIRGDWNDISSRLKAIIELCGDIDERDLIDQIENDIDEIYYDGRWFRDNWDGPYGPYECTPELVGQELYDNYAHLLTTY